MVKKGKGSLYTVLKETIELTSSKGERFEVGIAVTTATRLATFLVDGKFVGVNILTWAAPTFKRPYRMSVEELKGLKK
jgi:hypothetical protein